LLDWWGVETLTFKQGIISTLFFMTEIKDIHIGKRIKAKLKEQGRTTVWLAAQIPCTPNHMYKLYAKSSINTDLLKRISRILDYNFFEDFIQNG
jgi:hypothetical protein